MGEKNELAITLNHVAAKVAPWRGGLVSQLEVHGKPVLYLNRETLLDSSRSIRGGIPILFPFAGRLKQDTLVETGTQIPMHGFGRTMEWTFQETGEGEGLLILESTDGTEAIFPWAFRMEQRVQLLDRGVRVSLEIINRSDRPMPVVPGWHPYFPCERADKPGISGSLAGTEKGFISDDKETNMGLVAPENGEAKFSVPQLGSLLIRFSPAMRHLQIWSPPGEPYVCFEPFAGPPNHLNSPDAPRVPANRSVEFWMSIEVA